MSLPSVGSARCGPNFGTTVLVTVHESTAEPLLSDLRPDFVEKRQLLLFDDILGPAYRCTIDETSGICMRIDNGVYLFSPFERVSERKEPVSFSVSDWTSSDTTHSPKKFSMAPPSAAVLGYVSPKKENDPVAYIASRYFEALYSLQTPLTYFAKLAFTRARKMSSEGDVQYPDVLASVYLSTDELEKRWSSLEEREGEKEHREKYAARFLWDTQLKTRDAQLQILIAVEYIAFLGNEGQFLSECADRLKPKEEQQPLVRRKKKKAVAQPSPGLSPLNAYKSLITLIDQLIVWEALSESKKKSGLLEFVTNVLVAFYHKRVPLVVQLVIDTVKKLQLKAKPKREKAPPISKKHKREPKRREEMPAVVLKRSKSAITDDLQRRQVDMSVVKQEEEAAKSRGFVASRPRVEPTEVHVFDSPVKPHKILESPVRGAAKIQALQSPFKTAALSQESPIKTKRRLFGEQNPFESPIKPKALLEKLQSCEESQSPIRSLPQRPQSPPQRPQSPSQRPQSPLQRPQSPPQRMSPPQKAPLFPAQATLGQLIGHEKAPDPQSDSDSDFEKLLQSMIRPSRRAYKRSKRR